MAECSRVDPADKYECCGRSEDRHVGERQGYGHVRKDEDNAVRRGCYCIEHPKGKGAE
jgi:hypothetical protein